MRNRSSRCRLLPRPAERVASGWWLAVPLAFVAAFCWWLPNRTTLITAGGLGVLILVGSVVTTLDQRRLRRLAASRADESICTFARAFACRSTDTAVIHAVYEELQHHLCPVVPAFPFRADDHFAEDLRVDHEDLDDLAVIVAHRTRRTLENTKANPLFGRVHTVRDLIRFFGHQPLAAHN